MKKNNQCKDCGKNKKAPGRSRCYSCYGKARRGTPVYNFTNPTAMKMLFIDIETKPALGYFWGIHNENIGVAQIKEPPKTICFAAKWYDDNEVMFFNGREDHISMVEAAWNLLNEADVVVHFYGSRFDIPHLYREFLMAGFPPPKPFKQIDLKNIVAKQFKFISNKLQHVSTQLGLPGKEEHEGFPLWDKCMAGDEDAWARMESYNRQDVVLLEDVYEILLPWIPNHPHRWLYDGHSGCPTCGDDSPLQDAGYATTKVSKFRQYSCLNCGAYFRDSRRIGGVTLQESVL